MDQVFSRRPTDIKLDNLNNSNNFDMDNLRYMPSCVGYVFSVEKTHENFDGVCLHIFG